MDTCKANKCIKTDNLIYNGKVVPTGRGGWNDFVRCSKKVHKDGFCKRCYEPDKRYNCPAWIPDQLWKRDGIYGEPYDFPYHKKESEKEWVEMMYTLHPHLRPKESYQCIDEEEQAKNDKIARIVAEDKINKVLQWLDDNAAKINYKLGSELNEILTNSI